MASLISLRICVVQIFPDGESSGKLSRPDCKRDIGAGSSRGDDSARIMCSKPLRLPQAWVIDFYDKIVAVANVEKMSGGQLPGIKTI
jgi:hypothetical protein